MTDKPEVIAGRLEALRRELKFETDQDFAEAIGLSKGQYSLIKNGKRNLSFATACVIRNRWGFSIDWLYFGDVQSNASQIMARIGRGPVVESAPAKKRKKA